MKWEDLRQRQGLSDVLNSRAQFPQIMAKGLNEEEASEM